MLERIETEEEYREAVRRLLEICESNENSNENDELVLLMYLMEKYERENCSSN